MLLSIFSVQLLMWLVLTCRRLCAFLVCIHSEQREKTSWVCFLYLIMYDCARKAKLECWRLLGVGRSVLHLYPYFTQSTVIYTDRICFCYLLYGSLRYSSFMLIFTRECLIFQLPKWNFFSRNVISIDEKKNSKEKGKAKQIELSCYSCTESLACKVMM